MLKDLKSIKYAFQMLLLTTVALVPLRSNAQKEFSKEKTAIPGLSFHYGYYLPGGDLKERFGANSAVGGSFLYKDKKNFLYTMQGSFYFGSNVKEDDVISNLLTPQSEVLDKDAKISKILLFERGFSFNPSFGKVLNILNRNPNSGLFVTAGAGFFQHKLRVEHQENEIPQLEGDYIKGYERLCRGFSLNQTIGYFNLSNKKLTNFYIALDVHEAFTKRVYPINFNSGISEPEARLDVMAGVRVGWIFLIYKRMANDYYYQ